MGSLMFPLNFNAARKELIWLNEKALKKEVIRGLSQHPCNIKQSTQEKENH